MAKKNSTKTATKEALSASEPRVIAFRQWNGINIKEAPLGWTPLDPHHQETDLPDNYLMLQNNVVTTSSKALETRLDTVTIANAPEGWEFTGVVCLQENNIYAAIRSTDEEQDERIIGRNILDGVGAEWQDVPIDDVDRAEDTIIKVTSINYYQEKMIVLTEHSEIFVGKLSTKYETGVKSAPRVPDPTEPVTLELMGTLKEGVVTRVQVTYVYTNQFGPTLPLQYADGRTAYSVVYTDSNPVEWHAGKYLHIEGTAPMGYEITGVDLYCTLDENQDAIFIGHVNYSDEVNQGKWYYNWLGALGQDVTQWTNVSLTIPTSNDTKGVNARYMNVHDGRLYFMGGDDPYRLYIGGDPGNELSVARGLGGAFVDVEPGTGLHVNNTHKFKTYNGASIVTLMCGNVNTSNVKRFNLLETNVTVTNELQSKGYMTEEVSNVVGCNSHWGSGVFADGLYAISRYGLAVTTQAMESSNQLRAQLVSDPIQPIFTDRISELLSNARMIYVDGVVYIVFSVPDSDNDDLENINKHTGLDRVILCYDIDQKAWYTLTYEDVDHTNEEIQHVFNIDYQGYLEGIGIILPSTIKLIPVTGPKSEEPPEFTSIIETGELGIRLPPQIYCWLAQIELRFDYIVGELDVEIYGRDYYGRQYKIYKHISTKNKDDKYVLLRNHPEWIRCDRLVETYAMRIKGKAHFRLTHFLSKTYQQSSKIDLVYGYDSLSDYMGRHDNLVEEHHYLDSYNNLRLAIVT